MSYEDQPPPYSEGNYVSTAADAATVTTSTQITIGVLQQTGYPEGRQNITNNHITGSEGRQNDTNRHIIGTQNASNSFSGFLDIMYEQRKLPSGFTKNMIYRVPLLVYYFSNFIYSIIAVAVQRKHLVYHLIYMFICFIGLLFELITIIAYVRKRLTRGSDGGDDATQSRPNQVAHTGQPREAWTADTQVQQYHHKAKSLLDEYVIRSLGEILLYPTLICNLYGFINEGRNFDNGISAFNYLFFVYSVIMDVVYMKFYMIWLVIRIVQASYTKYDQLVRPTLVEWKRFFTPVYLTIPFAIVMALTHWFMTGIIGVRIYVDNFTLDRDDTNSSIPNTGDYRVAPLTGYMIGCAIYLPIVSWITYIVLNKPWFYEVYSAINQLSNGVDHMPPQDTWDEKLFAFIKDPWAYIATIFLIASFIAFTVGSYLPDYNSSEYEVALSARNALQGLAPCFIVFFLLSNLQAVITILLIVPCGLPILCIIACYKCINR